VAEEIPKILGRYEIQEELGRGMMGVVYRALDPALGRTVALKTVRLAFAIAEADRENFEKRFLAEARVAAGLSHPGIVIVHDVGRDEKTGTLYIALEYLNGTPLSAMVSDTQPMEWHQALRLVGRLADALHHAHAAGVVHRDIKPANIMVLANGEPKIMDFGIAKIPASQLTTAGEFFGTPSYMSPEQARGEAVDGRSDLFSLGSVLYYLLTGKRAFDAPSVPAILSHVATRDPQLPSSLVSGLPAQVDEIVQRTLAKDPSVRYPDGHSMAEDIEDVLAGRRPRHLAGWTPPRADGTFVSVTPLDEQLEPVPPSPLRTATLSRSKPASSARQTGRLIRLSDRLGTKGLLLIGSTLLLIVAAALVVSRRTPAARDVTPSSTTAEVPEPSPTASPTSLLSGLFSKSEPARLELTFEHSFQSGTLKVWVDDEEVLNERLKSAVVKKIGPVHRRRGRVSKVLEVTPGEHVIKVEVQGDDFSGGNSIKGTFEKGATRRLEVNKEGLPLLKKELSLEWS
jgi:serine/threonine-protein kinase